MANKKTEESKVKKENQMIDFSKISNDEIKNYIRDIELQKEKQMLLRERLNEEDSKIDILNQNISKLDIANVSLESEASKVRSSTTTLSSEIAELKMDLDKAQAETKLKRVKQIKADILINAKILKDQEDTIDKLRNKREEIRKAQENQRDRLLEKREQIEKIKNESIQNEFNNMDSELIDIIESTLTNNSDKTRIMSAALQEVSAEMKKVRALDHLNENRTNDNIELLKTQMLELNSIGNNGPINPIDTIRNAQAITSPQARISPKSARDIEAETRLIGRLDKLVSEGLITNEDKRRELEKFNRDNSISRVESGEQVSQRGKKKEKKIKKEKAIKVKEPKDRKPIKWSKGKILTVVILILVQLGIIAAIILFALGIIKI